MPCVILLTCKAHRLDLYMFCKNQDHSSMQLTRFRQASLTMENLISFQEIKQLENNDQTYEMLDEDKHIQAWCKRMICQFDCIYIPFCRLWSNRIRADCICMHPCDSCHVKIHAVHAVITYDLKIEKTSNDTIICKRRVKKTYQTENSRYVHIIPIAHLKDLKSCRQYTIWLLLNAPARVYLRIPLFFFTWWFRNRQYSIYMLYYYYYKIINLLKY